jgi:Cu(I)/Ag(I) efflux system membrane fusion protein
MVETNTPRSRWERAKLVMKVVEVRLRFVALLVVTGLVIGYWDTIRNYADKWTRAPRAPVTQAGPETEFFCPMHPSVVRPGLEPNGSVPRCPICGMPLAERKKGEAASAAPGAAGRVQLSPERIQLAGVSTALVDYRELRKEITTVGTVQYDEGRLSRIVARVSGFLERLDVTNTFTPVEKGKPLGEIYSPELYTAVRELLLTTKERGAQAELAKAARERLALLGIDEQEIARILETGEASPRLVIRSPQSGHVIQRSVVRGAHVSVGAPLFEIADLSKVWIEADVFERDIPFMKEGYPIEATVEAFPNRVFRGTIGLVHPHLEPATRTNTVRFTLDNERHDLRPGMFATVKVEVPLTEIEPFKTLARGGGGAEPPTEILAIPERAVIDTGRRKIVYVEREPGVFDGVEVELGPRVGTHYPVVKGLARGDRVAAEGSFLIDAETRLNPAAAGTYMGAAGGPQGGAKPVQPTPAPRPGLAALSPKDRELATAQAKCPIGNSDLGSMGPPVKIDVNGHTVFLCCAACEADLRKDPDAVLRKLGKKP